MDWECKIKLLESTRYEYNLKTKENGTFEVVDRQGLVGKFFGGIMLICAGYLLFLLTRAIFEYLFFGSLRDIIVALPGMALTLFVAALFGVPGVLMGFLKTQTLCNKTDGQIRQYKYFGLFRTVRDFQLSDVKRVAARYRTTKSSTANRNGSGTQVPVVLLVFTDKKQEVAQPEKWEKALELGQQLAGYLGVEF